jgi:hypothetical protein
VTRQYDEARRTKRIFLVFATLILASEFRIFGSPFTICAARNCRTYSFALH